MKQKTFALSIAMTAAVVLLGSRLYWGGGHQEDPSAEATHGAMGASARLETSPGTEIAPRQVDPARSAPVEWVDDGVDASHMRELIRKAPRAHVLMQSNYDAYGHLDGWSAGMIDDSELGQALLACRLEHERNQERACLWGQAFVLQRDGELGTVRYIQARRSSPTPPECRAWMECTERAYRGAQVPWPDDAMLQDELVLKDAILHLFGPTDGPMGLQAYIEGYRSALREAESELQAARRALEEHGPVPPILHAIRSSEQRVRMSRLMLDRLEREN